MTKLFGRVLQMRNGLFLDETSSSTGLGATSTTRPVPGAGLRFANHLLLPLSHAVDPHVGRTTMTQFRMPGRERPPSDAS
jgi:hypothetical protein